MVVLKNNDNISDSINIAYLALLVDYDYTEEFLAMYSRVADSIVKLSVNSKQKQDFANITKVLNYLKSTVELEVKK